jgi:hypothetical protein
MKKTKLFTITTIGLLLLNLTTLGFLIISGPKGHRPPPLLEENTKPRELIIDKLHFNGNQQKEYDILIKYHQEKIKSLDNDIRYTKNELYSKLSQKEVSVKIKDSLASLLAGYQKQVEETHFKHFEDIKKICHSDQLDDYKALTEELSRIFAFNKP